jgi:cytochrome b subunit of formate dehydrogenase
MDKVKINYFIDVLLALSFVIVAITSLIIFFFLPSGVRQAGYQTFWGITKRVWSQIHTISGLSMIALSLIHLILHFNWFVCITKTFFKKKSKECKK